MPENRHGERLITVDRGELISHLQENMTRHTKEYKEAVANYQELALKRLEKLREETMLSLTKRFGEIKEKIERFDPNEDDPVGNLVRLIHAATFELQVPEDHTRDYEQAIVEAQWEVSDKVELTATQVRNFIRDDWDWQEDFQKVSATYASMNRGGGHAGPDSSRSRIGFKD